MKLLKRLSLLCCLLALSGCSDSAPADCDDAKVVVAYVTSWSDVIPDPSLMTHLNYAFGHVNDSFDGVRVDNPDRLRTMVSLRDQAPGLKVMLSIGGWGSGRFSEMADDPQFRASFCADCRRVVDEFGLDGIDIDWEYPGSDAAGISSSENDVANFNLLMKGIREAIGDDKLLTLASSAGAQYIDFRQCVQYLDFVNVMSYDMANPPYHHSALYDSEISADMTTERALKAHIMAGVPKSKLVMGMPFYGRGDRKSIDWEHVDTLWSDAAKVPYLVDAEGRMVFGFENVESLSIKCDYIIDNDFHGAMYWDYADNDSELSFSRCVAGKVMGKPSKKQILILTERGGQHGPFTDAALEWLRDEGEAKGYSFTEINDTHPITSAFLAGYSAVIQLDFPPYTWDSISQAAFTEYIEKGLGGWVGFHHASLLGEFDGWPMWDWFSHFMGDIVYQNYIPELSDGKVTIEDPAHPVMAGVDGSFVIEDDEWYIYDVSPRANVHVLANVDEDSYTLDTTVKMGDHPVVWVNGNMGARNVYFQMGHSPKLLSSKNFTTMFSNAIQWASEK